MIELPKLPRGLEYHRITVASQLCQNCMGLVERGPLGVMVRQSHKRKKNRFLNYFPHEDGFCLPCSRKQLGRFIGNKFSEAGEAIAAADKLEMDGGTAEDQRLIVDGIQETIKSLGEYLGQSSKIQQAFKVLGTRDIIGEMEGVTPKPNTAE